MEFVGTDFSGFSCSFGRFYGLLDLSIFFEGCRLVSWFEELLGWFPVASNVCFLEILSSFVCCFANPEGFHMQFVFFLPSRVCFSAVLALLKGFFASLLFGEILCGLMPIQI